MESILIAGMTMTPGRPPLTNGHSLKGARTVTDAMFGAFSNYAGGLVVRWVVDKGDGVLLTFASEQVFDLRDQFEKAIAHFKKHQVALEPIEAVRHLAPEDFEKANVGILGWHAHMASDGILWRLDASDESHHVFVLRPLLVAAVHQVLVAVIDQMTIIDLRPFRDMRWTEMADEFEKLPGHELRSRVTAFEFSVEIFRRNGSALTTHLRKGCGELDDELVRWDRRFQIDTFLMDTIHLLFNFVGAAMALVEHTRAETRTTTFRSGNQDNHVSENSETASAETRTTTFRKILRRNQDNHVSENSETASMRPGHP
jgi:hypothetical protein